MLLLQAVEEQSLSVRYLLLLRLPHPLLLLLLPPLVLPHHPGTQTPTPLAVRLHCRLTGWVAQQAPGQGECHPEGG